MPTSRTGCAGAGASRFPTPSSGDPGGAGAGQRPARRPPEPHGTRRRPAARTGPRSAMLAVRSLKVAGTFTTIAVLWSLWSSPSLSAWLDMLQSRVPWIMRRLMSRQLIVTLVILACGLVPDRLCRRWAVAAARQLEEQPLQPGRPRADRARLLRAVARPGRRLDDLADVPGLRHPAALGQHLVGPRRRSPAGHARRRPARGRLEAE